MKKRVARLGLALLTVVVQATLLLAGCRYDDTAVQSTFPEARNPTPVFTNGSDGYACYRIPAIIRTPNGSLLAFAEGRTNGCSDFGNVDIVLRTSNNNGVSWSPLKIVADFDTLQAGNPSPVVDRLDANFPVGRIFLAFNTGIASEQETRKGNGLREVWYTTSNNNGLTWSDPTNITTSVHRPLRPDIDPAYNFADDWRSYAIAPGHAIQLTNDRYAGRLLFPANHSEGDPLDRFDEYRSHVFFSDDHGRTWQLGGSVDVPSANEAIAAELDDGRVMLNIREQSGRERKRLVATSSDGGATWENIHFDDALPGPVCQASILNVTLGDGRSALLFSNPASTERRERMTIRTSFDSGETWPIAHEIDAGPSAYSDLVGLADGQIGLLYERGNDGGIVFWSGTIASLAK